MKNNLKTTLARLNKMIEEVEDFAEELATILEEFLDEYLSNDGFGTEGQNDPRGDFRDGEWSIFGEIQ